MGNKRISERKVIVYTAGLLLFTGVIRYLFYSVGSVLFYLAFAPYVFYRAYSYHGRRKSGTTTSIDFVRNIVLAIMLVTIVLNIAGWQEADFFLLFLLMVDYLLVINKRF